MPLYKYVTKERIDILEGGMIRFTQPIAFNDPFELKPHIASLGSAEYAQEFLEENFDEVLKKEYESLPIEAQQQVTIEQLKNFVNSQKMNEMLVDMISNLPHSIESSIHTALNSKLGILCLSESTEPDNLLMWSHYADSHEGFAIEFDAEHPFFDQKRSEDDQFRQLNRVTYQSNRPELIFNEVDNFQNFLVKSTQWEYEQEWRMLTDLSSADKSIETNEHSVHLFNLPFSALKSITFGCKASAELKQEIKSILSDNENLKHIELYEALEDRKEYKLNRTKFDANKQLSEGYPSDLLEIWSDKVLKL